MEVFTLTAQPRAATGRPACRRMRRQGLVPAVLYGRHQEALALQVNALELERHMLNEAFYSHILSLQVNNEVRKVVLKDLQRHPYEPRILHLDLQSVAEDEQLTMRVPLHFTNADTCEGVKLGGGVLTYVMTELEVVCLPKHLPEYIEVDVGALELNHTLHLGDLKLPPEVQVHALLHGGDAGQPVVSVQASKMEVEVKEEEEEAPIDEEQDEAEAADGDTGQKRDK